MLNNVRRYFSIAFLLFIVCGPAFALKLAPPNIRQLIVETVYTYQVFAYEEVVNFTAGVSMPKIEEQTPEYALADYLSLLATGKVQIAMSRWTTDSQMLIAKRNKNFTIEQLAKNTRAQNEGVVFTFVGRITYGNFVILHLKSTRAGSKSPETFDSYALIRENSSWKLTQELADDPVMCCRDAGQARIQRVGVPGGEFRQMLEALKQ